MNNCWSWVTLLRKALRVVIACRDTGSKIIIAVILSDVILCWFALFKLLKHLPSSSLGSSWVTLTCRRSTRSPNVFTLMANCPAWSNSSPNTSSANLPTRTHDYIFVFLPFTFATFYEPVTKCFKKTAQCHPAAHGAHTHSGCRAGG